MEKGIEIPTIARNNFNIFQIILPVLAPKIVEFINSARSVFDVISQNLENQVTVLLHGRSIWKVTAAITWNFPSLIAVSWRTTTGYGCKTEILCSDIKIHKSNHVKAILARVELVSHSTLPE